MAGRFVASCLLFFSGAPKLRVNGQFQPAVPGANILHTPGKFPGNEVAFQVEAEGASTTVYGTKFTFMNYYSVMTSYLVAGGLGYTAMDAWYQGMTAGDPMVGIGPGPNTTMYYGWDGVKTKLLQMAPWEKNYTLKRYNELGVQIENNVMWPETGTIALGYGKTQHDLVRPYLWSAFDGAQGAPGAACDGTTCWNKAWLKNHFRTLFQGMNTFTSGDLKWFITIPLHKIAADASLTNAEAQEFASYMLGFVIPAPFPQSLAETSLFKMAMGVDAKLKQKSVYINRMKTGIKRKWPTDNWNEDKLTLTASAFLDGLLLAGGLSVPTVLEYMLALYFTWGIQRPTALNGADLADNTTLYNYMFETMRRYPPVAGVPRWVKDSTGAWKHQIPLVSQALQDPVIFPNPKEFILGRPGFNAAEQTRSIGWADFALDEGSAAKPGARVCPGKELSMVMIAAFMEEFVAAGPWQPAFSSIIINLYKTTGFTLCKKSAFWQCRKRQLLVGLAITSGVLLLCCCCCCCALGCWKLGVCKKGKKGKSTSRDADDEDDEYSRDDGDDDETTPVAASSKVAPHSVDAVPVAVEQNPVLVDASTPFITSDPLLPYTSPYNDLALSSMR